MAVFGGRGVGSLGREVGVLRGNFLRVFVSM